MIHSLTIENFQSHKKTFIKFTEGVNVIAGPSGYGKTVILRALEWLIDNRPGGDEYRSWWGGDTIVTGVFSLREGILFEVSRIKTNSINKYTLTCFDQDGDISNTQEYTGFGVHVPDPIAEFINMSDVNIQGQLDLPFLLSDTPGEVARQLNKAVRLNDIDTGLSSIGSTYRTANQSLAFEKNEQKECEECLEQFDYLPAFLEDIEELEQIEKDKDANFQKKEKLSFLLKRIEKGEEWMKNAPPIKEIKQEIETLIGIPSRLKEISQKADRLDDLLSEISKQEEKAKQAVLVKKAKQAIEIQLKKIPKLKKLQANIFKLNNIISSIHVLEAKAEVDKRELTRMKKEFAELFPDICPLCGK